MRDIHRGFGPDRPVGLRHALCHWHRHFGQRIADIYLPADNVIRPAIKRQRAGQAGNAMFGSRIGG